MDDSQIQEDSTRDELYILDILNEMRRVGLESTFICQLMEICQQYDGVQDLMEMWFEETDEMERDEIIEDLRECLNDIYC